MGLNITIDQGNSSVKVAIWDGTHLVEEENLKELTRQQLARIVDRFRPGRALCCSVTGNGRRYVQWLNAAGVDAAEVSLAMPLPLQFDYATPSTLGADRIAAAAGAWSLMPGRNMLVVDMGTAVTYDFVSAEGRFKGGNIAPGIGMRLRSLHNYTARLPEVNGYGDIPRLGHARRSRTRRGRRNLLLPLPTPGRHRSGAHRRMGKACGIVPSLRGHNRQMPGHQGTA